MKALFSYCHLPSFVSDSHVNPKIGFGWYKHHKDNKWRGITVEFYLFKWIFFITFVDNYEEYNKKINRKRDPDHMKKLGERLKAIREKK
jgi:hypothetical protein